jgi:hypothetical protein
MSKIYVNSSACIGISQLIDLVDRMSSEFQKVKHAGDVILRDGTLSVMKMRHKTRRM